MKNLLYTLSAAAIFIFSACKKDYLDTMPTDSYASDQVFTTVDNAWNAINGIHRSLYKQYDSQDQGGQGSMMIVNDMLGDDLVMTAAGNGWFNTTYKWTMHRNSSATLLEYSYLFYYKIISNANMIINNIDGATGSESDRKNIKGQAYAYRAWAYLNLVQYFGKRYDASGTNTQPGVPVLTTNTTVGQPRSTVEQVYTQINLDADSAIADLTIASAPNNKSHISLATAKGIKARIALTQQNWAVAAKYAAEAKAGYTLMTNASYQTGFNDYTNGEWMWGSHQISEQTSYFYSFFAYMSSNFNSTNIRTNPKAINKTLYNQISATDVRKKMWSVDGTGVTVPSGGVLKAYMNKKFLAASSSSSIGDVPIMRAAEMYLIEAEADARMGQDAAAADVLYTLAVNRDPSYVKSTKTGNDLLQEILVQRRIELWGEGFRFFDLKRMDAALDRTGANHSTTLTNGLMTMPAGDKQWQFLIPQDELNANKAIEQNEL
ncbi:RagB/SusD family nutrient uptake outer membrane protein [Chitinophaga sancti]|uniref:RagB/SusD family nutrient uptake outer membrane protein n=1 Tax=Chitinophaga sancti TaxID=1004 RepID=UPI002A747FF7|nr:RagB/SusD family nutrient uptake outer membrane protein [Chitinophaga sancti]WPQ62456.1 RagB/SusD family nutrient uptake outer membrane protein [Chitinophaga sancti]